MNTYDVAPADVAGELPGLFPGGFSATTAPTSDQVQGFIDAADAIVTLAITDFVGMPPSLTDKAAAMAKRYVIEYTKALVVRVVYAGRVDPSAIGQLASPYEINAAAMLKALELLGSQAIGTGDASPRVLTSMGSSSLPSRDLLIETVDLDPNSGLRGRF